MDKRNDKCEVINVPPKKKKIPWKNISIYASASVFILVLSVVLGALIYMNSIGINYVSPDDNNIQYESNTDDHVLFEDLEEEQVEEMYSMITSVRNDSRMSTKLYDWYTNGGDHMYSRDVLNILIIGVDGREASMQGNSDAMMLASVNKKTESITLCSFLRDSYTYFETSEGMGYYSKLTSAYGYGGADCLVNAIENNYKIRIDYFVTVDFASFEKVIDAIGGINMDVTEEEAKAMEDYAKITGVPHGKNVHLTGEHALLFARMRKIYATGDVQRSQNQRKVINAIIKKTKTLSLNDINNVVQTLGQYIYTDCPMSKIISLGTNAVMDKWYNYKIYSMEAPPESARKDYKGSTWMWMVDYPYSAQYVQKQIYGETNIVIQ
ncbi:MAG: LCP family protein [Clostridia bacterium]|nr:LCP family protein [Clostridia bacterium]